MSTRKSSGPPTQSKSPPLLLVELENAGAIMCVKEIHDGQCPGEGPDIAKPQGSTVDAQNRSFGNELSSRCIVNVRKQFTLGTKKAPNPPKYVLTGDRFEKACFEEAMRRRKKL
jgi:hypothetical protein